jgi:predicted 3-demethylubiquinone-9 3-methyltransferase (glyoxalase superfamily)
MRTSHCAVHTATPNDNRVRKARDHYASIFSDHHLLMEMPPASNEPLLFCQFRLGSMLFNTMRSMETMDFQLGPGNSFVISCADQTAIDHYWHKLGAGGVFERCGWLRDRFGVSWKVVPEILPKLMQDPERGGRVMEALLGMDQIVLDKLMIE